MANYPTPSVKPVPILPARLDWPSTIGNFLLNFGALEHLIFAYLKDRLQPEEYLKIRVWHLKDRLDRIVQYLKDVEASEDQQAKFQFLVKRLDPIREMRNRIAHGHLYMFIDDSGANASLGILMARDSVEDYEESKLVQFEGFTATLSELTEVIEDFKRISGCHSNRRAGWHSPTRPL